MLQIPLISSIIYVMTKVVSRMYRKMDYRSFRLLVFIFFFTYALGNIYFTILSRTAMSERLIELLPFASYGRIFDESTAVSGNKLNGWLARFFLNTNNPAEGIILNILLYPVLNPLYRTYQFVAFPIKNYVPV